jgi:hypothetical protein
MNVRILNISCAFLSELNVGRYKKRSRYGATRNFNKTLDRKPHAKTSTWWWVRMVSTVHSWRTLYYAITDSGYDVKLTLSWRVRTTPLRLKGKKEVKLHTFYTWAPKWGGWSASVSRYFIPWNMISLYSLDRAGRLQPSSGRSDQPITLLSHHFRFPIPEAGFRRCKTRPVVCIRGIEGTFPVRW